MNSTKYKSISLLVVLALLLSAFAVVIPSAPVQAAASPVVTSPLTASPTPVKQQGSVSIQFAINSSDNGTYSCQATIYQGSTSYQSAAIGYLDNGSLRTLSINTPPGAPTGFYNAYVQAEGVSSPTISNAVIVDSGSPQVSIITPNTGSCYKSGSTQDVILTVTDVATTDNVFVYAYLSNDGGTSYTTPILTGGSKIQGTITQPVVLPGGTYSGKVIAWAYDRAGNVSENKTSAAFPVLASIAAPAVTYPVGGEVINGKTTGTYITGTLNTGSISSINFLVSLFVGGVSTDNITPGWVTASTTVNGTYTTITTPGVLTLRYPWTVENNVKSSSCKIRIYEQDCAGNISWAESASTFRIVDVTVPTVTATAPTSGVKWYAGSTDNITWTQTDNVLGNLNYTIALSLNGGTDLYPYPIASGNLAQGSSYVQWVIPAAGYNSTYCILKFTISDTEILPSTGLPNSTIVYSPAFQIIAGVQPIVTVTMPNGGQSWQVGSPQTITWTATDSSNTAAPLDYTIELTPNSGTNWITLAILTNQSQYYPSFSWAVSDNVSTNCLVRVTARNPLSGQSGTNVSPAVFTITAPDFPVETYTIHLKSGWNLISLPLIPTNTNIRNILSTCIGSVNYVWQHNGYTSWYSFAPNLPTPINTLTSMVDGKGYWINMSADADFTFQGRKGNPAPSIPPVYTTAIGWNLIGFKSAGGTHSVSNYLGTNVTNYNLPITGFNATTKLFTVLDGTTPMVSGNGYWVYYTSAGYIAPPAD